MNAPEGWTDPPEDMREMAAALFATFTALCGAGFTEQQALAVIGHLLTGAQAAR